MGKRQNLKQLHSLLVIQKSSDCKCALRVAPANRLGRPAGAVICNSTSASAKQSVADSFHILARILSTFWDKLISFEIFWGPLRSRQIPWDLLRSLWDPMLTILTILTILTPYMQKAGDSWDISPQFFLDFPQNFRLRTRNQYCTQAIAWGSTI